MLSHFLTKSRFSEDSFRRQSIQSNLVLIKKKRVKEEYKVLYVIGDGSISTIFKIEKKAKNFSRFKKFLSRRSLYDDNDSKDIAVEVQQEDGAGVFAEESKKRNIFALKTIDKRIVQEKHMKELMNELKVLRTLDHPNIMRAYEVFEWKKELGIVIELCSGGDLFARSPYTEEEAADVMNQILHAIAYMHNRLVMHRDIKYENIMFENGKKDAAVKLIDFGLSKIYMKKNVVFNRKVGTIYTMAPEVLIGPYTKQADMWSLGVVAFMMLTSVKPFWGIDPDEVKRQILTRDLNVAYGGSLWSYQSENAKDFVKSLMQRDPKKRMTASQALEHPWLLGRRKKSSRKNSYIALRQKVDLNLVDYAETNQLKKMCLTFIAHRATPEDITKLRDMFDEFDSDNDGYISKEDLKEGLRQYSSSEVDRIFKGVNLSGDGMINYTEFLAASIEAQMQIDYKKLVDAFDNLDMNNEGYITKDGLRKFLGRNVTEEMLDKVFQECDDNCDQKITFDELMSAFIEQKSTQIRRLSQTQ